MRACVCVPTALVVRLKPNGVAKSRRCVRGGCAKGTQQHSTSAPKAGRCLVRICLSRADNLRYDVIACDIRQAFIQAGVFPPKDKYYILPPPCVSLVGLSAVVKYRINPPYGSGYSPSTLIRLQSPLVWIRRRTAYAVRDLGVETTETQVLFAPCRSLSLQSRGREEWCNYRLLPRTWGIY